MKRSILTSILLSVFLISCSTSSSPPSSVAMLTGIHITYLNEQGIDLTNPDRPHPISEEKLRMYYLVDGEKKIHFNTLYNNPNGITLRKPEATPTEYYAIRYWPSIIENQNQAITYIQFEDGSYDTLKVQYDATWNSNFQGVAVTKIWYNHELQWAVEQRTERYFIVTKSEGQ